MAGGYNGYKKKEFDPTIVSAKDVMMARMNAVTAAYNLAAAQIQANAEVIDINAEVERIFEAHLAAADNERVGKADPSVVRAAASTIEKTFGGDTTEEADDSDDSQTSTSDVPYADMELKGGKYGGYTLADVYEDDPKYVEGFLAVPFDSKRNFGNKNKFTLKAAQQFLKAVNS